MILSSSHLVINNKNTVKIAGKDVVVNTKIENWKFVNRLAEVVKTPLAFKSGIKKR